ncbi:MAG: ferritin-like domain-containing protein [candidate division NC10 bacterium]
MKLVIENTCPTQWRFEYESANPELEDLYELAKTDQWNVTTDINWDRVIREDSDILAPNEDAFARSKFFASLGKGTQREVMANQAAFTLSQFLHGEQGALLCCGELVDAVPTVEGKLYAATQVMDEARHVEVFHKYLKKLDKHYPIIDGLKNVLDAILEAETWQAKCVGMQIMVESLAMGAFKNMLVGAADPLLKDIVTLTARDEARHVSFGIISLQHEIPNMPEDERAALEDFALAALNILAGRTGDARSPRSTGFAQPLIDAGLDMQELREALRDEYRSAGGPPKTNQQPLVQHYMIPNLERVGLISDRMRPQYIEAGFMAPEGVG